MAGAANQQDAMDSEVEQVVVGLSNLGLRACSICERGAADGVRRWWYAVDTHTHGAWWWVCDQCAWDLWYKIDDNVPYAQQMDQWHRRVVQELHGPSNKKARTS